MKGYINLIVLWHLQLPISRHLRDKRLSQPERPTVSLVCWVFKLQDLKQTWCSLGFHKLHLSLALDAAGAQPEHNVGGVNLGDLSERWNLLTPDRSNDMQLFMRMAMCSSVWHQQPCAGTSI